MEEDLVIWTESAKEQLEEIYRYIAEDSILQADITFDKIISAATILSQQPYKFPPDKYKIDNDNSYRAFEIYRYRISYKITSDVIYIIRIRSTYQNPVNY